MEIIAELEPEVRGVYAGAVGYLDFRGSLDTAIALRTAVVCKGRLHLQAAAGIVADSDPAEEAREIDNKLRALVRAVEAVRTPVRRRGGAPVVNDEFLLPERDLGDSVVVVDNYDSFTFNLVQRLGRAGGALRRGPQ